MATNKNITMKQFNGTDYDTLYPKTIASQVDGLLWAQILVTTHSNTEVTASLNGKTVSAMSDSSGLAILKIPSYGTWTVSATIGGIFTSINCEIKTVAQYEVALFPDLETISWDDINSISESGNASSILRIGDKKTVAIDGVNYEVQIIGFNHDTKTSGGKAGITFQLVRRLKTTYPMDTSELEDNSRGWTRCTMRTSTMATLLTKLPSALQNVIKAVNKLTSAGSESATINTTSDKLFLLSEVEVFGTTQNSFAGEGSQYDYYKAGNSYDKGAPWWERSPAKDSLTNFCMVGNLTGDEAIAAYNSLGVSFAFCV